MSWAERERLDRQERLAKAFPHGPDESCTCDGFVNDGGKCVCFPGHIVGCTCDIDWDWDN